MTKSGKLPWCVATFCILLALALLIAALGVLAVALVWSRAPGFEVAGARLDNIHYSYLQLVASNIKNPTAVVFRELEISIVIANKTVAVIQDAGPFHVRARGVLPLGTYVATSTIDVQLSEAGVDVHHVIPFTLVGHAKTERNILFVHHVKQAPKLSCNVNVDLNYLQSGQALSFDACRSETEYRFLPSFF